MFFYGVIYWMNLGSTPLLQWTNICCLYFVVYIVAGRRGSRGVWGLGRLSCMPGRAPSANTRSSGPVLAARPNSSTLNFLWFVEHFGFSNTKSMSLLFKQLYYQPLTYRRHSWNHSFFSFILLHKNSLLPFKLITCTLFEGHAHDLSTILN